MQGRFLLRPSRDLNDHVYGILARAANKYAMDVVYFVALSNHLHVLCIPENAKQLARFMEYLDGNLAKEAGRLHQWREKFWARRYRPINVSDEPEAQEARLRYLLENGCKEGLVDSPKRWPGASGVEALLTGNPVRGWWFDRTAEYEARRRNQRYGKYDHAEVQELTLVPLPCWADRTEAELQEAVAAMVSEIETETKEMLRREGRSPMGAARIEKQNAHDAPDKPSRSPAPRFHTATPMMRKSLEYQFREFRHWYRAAAEALRDGCKNVEVPPDCFPPGRPFYARGDPPLNFVPSAGS